MKSSWSLVGLVTMVALDPIFAGCTHANRSGEQGLLNPLNGPGPSVDPNAPAYATTLPMMANAFKSNADDAERLFHGHRITVDGHVTSVATDKDGWTLFITDSSQPPKPVSGSFRFSPKTSNKAKNLTTGAYVWCTGRYGRVDDGGLIEFYGDDVKVTLPPRSGSWAKD